MHAMWLVVCLVACQADLAKDHVDRQERLVSNLDAVITRMKATTPTTTVAELEQSLGPRLRDIGSGIHIFVYNVDGDELRIGSADGTKVMYIRRVHAGTETVLYGP